MALTIEAIYENGALKPIQPLQLKEHETVRITIEAAGTLAERSAGMLQWTGDPEVLQRVATDPEFSILEAYDHDALLGCLGQPALGEQLLREAREGHAEFVAGWNEFMKELGIHGQPVGVKKLREMLLEEGINPESNEFSQGIIAMREE